MNGSHRPEGVLIVAGPGTQRGVRLEQAHIVDVAPTLLHLLGAELPGHMDGRVLNEALYPAAETRALGPRARGRTIVDAGGRPENRGPEPVQSSQVPEASSEEDGWPGGTPYSRREAAAVEKTLRGLGYRP
jgi:arylsulfatase A-like enzyme